MNKFLFYIFFVFASVQLSAQETVTDSVPVLTFIPVDTTAAYTPRNFEPGFKERYTGNDFIYEHKAVAKSGWERFKEWLQDVLDEIFSFGDGAQRTPAYALIIRIIGIIILLLVVYFIVRAILGKEANLWIFGRSRKNIAVQDIHQENIHQMNFSQLIEETKKSGNYRLGVRYYYLWLLKKLSNREIIDWHWDKTNTDYLYEIKDSGLRKDFEYLSYVYDYSWYGEFDIDQAAFSKAEKAFVKTINSL